MTVSGSIHVSANGKILFLLMAEQFSIVYMYHTFCIHSSVDGHLGWFYVLAIVSSAAVNTGVHVFFELWFPPGIGPGLRMLGHMIVLFLVF